MSALYYCRFLAMSRIIVNSFKTLIFGCFQVLIHDRRDVPRMRDTAFSVKRGTSVRVTLAFETVRCCLINKERWHLKCLRLRHFFPIENAAFKMHIDTRIASVLSPAISATGAATFFPRVHPPTVRGQCNRIYVPATYLLMEPYL